MKNKKIISTSSLQLLKNHELNNINGGWIPVALIGTAIAYIADKCIDDWTCFKDGLAGRLPNHK